MADKIIVVEKRRGCGCGSFVLLLVLAVVTFVVFVVRDAQLPDAQSAPSAPDDPNAPRGFPEELSPAIVEIQFKKALRGYLRDPDSYRPHGAPRVGAHPKGRAYFQDFTARNAMGGPSRQIAGLLFSTNKAEAAWTFYSPETVAELMNAVKAQKVPQVGK